MLAPPPQPKHVEETPLKIPAPKPLVKPVLSAEKPPTPRVPLPEPVRPPEIVPKPVPVAAAPVPPPPLEPKPVVPAVAVGLPGALLMETAGRGVFAHRQCALEGLGRGVLSYGGRVGLNDCAETPSVQVTIHDFGPITVVQEVRNLKTADPKRGATLIVGTEGYLSGGAGGVSAYDGDGKLVAKLSGPNEDHFANFIKAVRSRKTSDQNGPVETAHLASALARQERDAPVLWPAIGPEGLEPPIDLLPQGL